MNRIGWSGFAFTPAALLCVALLCSCGRPEQGNNEPAQGKGTSSGFDLSRIRRVIVIYQENWSFDGLYSHFRDAKGEHANGYEFGALVRQLDGAGNAIDSMDLPVNSRRQPFRNPAWKGHMPVMFYNMHDFDAGDSVNVDTVTTADVTHRFYHTQKQINRNANGEGTNNQFLYWSDLDAGKAFGRDNMNALVLSGFRADTLPLGKLAAQYAMCDNCFQSAFGGSFLNHQWLIAARTPVYRNATKDSNAMKHRSDSASTAPNHWDDALTRTAVPGDPGSYYAINTVQPAFAPHLAKGVRLPAQEHATIGTRLDAANISWKWYAQGWKDALADTTKDPDDDFATHHQPFNYFKEFDPGTESGRRNREAHLADERDFHTDLRSGRLPTVSFVKLNSLYDEHPLDANLRAGDSAAAGLVQEIMDSAEVWKDCAIIVTFDEFGGRWDHVPPPPPAPDGFGPGPRIPMMIISPFTQGRGIDHTQYETVSVLALIEKIWGLPPLSDRDARANNLVNAFTGGPAAVR
ncbi:MAG: alkaline phosphatase family protein [Bacteroidetes bacterium]|nr:alkaline phosphatase family protein [Bacteroidota bacterium]